MEGKLDVQGVYVWYLFMLFFYMFVIIFIVYFFWGGVLNVVIVTWKCVGQVLDSEDLVF